MGLPLAEYRVTRSIRESPRSQVFEAVRERDGKPVIAKVFDIEDEADEDRVQHEFELIRSLDFDGVVRAEELRRVGDQLILVLEPVPGVNLAEYAGGRPLPLEAFWPIATQLADILARTHTVRVIHRDIKPTNILIHAHTGRVHLVDFGISVLLENERRHIYNTDVFVGTLPYISPEQTGRTSRSVDFRSDLYSLGVTFYELLTGRLPFESPAPLELIHAHLAREPQPPDTLRPGLPIGLSRLILKLLAKAPEQRYQTAQGLAADLRRLQALSEAGQDDSTLELGREDLATTLRVPHQLYGRERERAELSKVFNAVAGTTDRWTVALTGPAGIGKSELIRELEAAVVGHGGYMVRGKFDAVRETPYAGFAEAFTALFEQVLTESDARLDRWRRQLSEGLGNLASVLAELSPTLELILGRQPAPVQLDATESRNRIQIAAERLLGLVCSEGRPLVMVLEDLHCAGPTSIRLLEALVHGRRGPLLVITSMQLDAVDPEHPVRNFVAELATHPRARTIELRGLELPAIEALLTDTLPGTVDVGPLARILARKTNGVPLFIGQLLEQLAERDLLRRGPSGWEWDAAQVEAEPIPDDAVAMVSARLDSVSKEARELIRRAACIGTRFDLQRLALVAERSRAELTANLIELEDSGLLARVGTDYHFPHLSVHRAALHGLDPETRRRLHWTIGRELLAITSATDDRLFEIVDHLAAGLPTEPDEAVRLELADLDLRAGIRALDSGAYDLAHVYLRHGSELTAARRAEVIERGAAAPGYELVFRLHFTRAYSLALAGRREEADREFAQLLGWKLEDRHYGEVVARRVRLLWLETRYREAIELGWAGLERLGVDVPRSPEPADARASLVRAWQWVRDLDRADFEALPRCTNERDAAIVEVVYSLKYATLTGNNKVFLLLAGLHVLLAKQVGYHPSTPVAISDLALGLCGHLGEISEAARLLDLARELARSEPTAISEVRILSVAGVMSFHRSRPFSEIVTLLEQSYQRGLEIGEFSATSFTGTFAIDMQLEIGTHLRVLSRHCRRVNRDVGRWCPKQMRVLVWMLRGVAAGLLGPEAEAEEASAADEVWDLDPAQVFPHGGAPTSFRVAIIYRALIALVFDDSATALEICMRELGDAEQVLFNNWALARAFVVTCAAYYMQVRAGASPGPEADARVARGIEMLERWVVDAPANYSHYLDLVLGLKAAVDAQGERSARLLDRAWQRARQRGCRWVEGVAASQLAELLEREGLGSLVDGARERAWEAYAAWGAEAKLAQMRKAHPQLFGDASDGLDATRTAATDRRTGGRRRTGDLRISASTPPLDLAEILRSVGAMTEDLQLEEVVARVLDAALTNVGADHGMLVLEQNNELVLIAETGAVGEPQLFANPPRLTERPELAPNLLINFVFRTGKSVVLDDVRNDLRFAGDSYLDRTQVRSVLGLPLVKGERRLGVLVLENRLTTHGFRTTSIEALRLITNQAASTLENAQLYSALRRSEARWRSLVDGAPDLIALLDERGRVVFRNHAGPLTGIDETDDERDGALRSESTLRWREAVAAVLRDGERRELELEYLPANGPPRWYTVRLAPIEVDRGLGRGSADERDVTHRHAVAVATDVSASKRAEAEKRQLEAQLRQQQRLESVGTLASGVAHEINNPIQGIMNYADLIHANASRRELVEEFADEINRESNRVAAIVRNLLAFSRQDATAELEATQLGIVVEATLSLIHAVLRRDHIKVTVDVEPRLPLIRCRAQQIQQIVMNLVTNARDALNSRYGAYDSRKQIEIRVERSDRLDWVRVCVRDTGPGIPPEVLPRIFDPFFTTKGRNEGTGLGLAVSHGIARDHGGELRVETELGVGACFVLELPTLGSEDSVVDVAEAFDDGY
jgi:predicted ATPase/signal transduction histidine kinase/tRNA A-37 threonylcarbamoyl transferase component Bud32